MRFGNWVGAGFDGGICRLVNSVRRHICHRARAKKRRRQAAHAEPVEFWSIIGETSVYVVDLP